MKIGNIKVTPTCSFIYSYNCALGCLGMLNLNFSDGHYHDKTLLAPHALELAKEFLIWLKHPPNEVTKPGHWLAYQYDLAFYVFHDNIKSIGNAETGNPLYDMSSFLEFMSNHEKELGVTIIKTPMVDNLWHTPKGSHPGRVFILIPPWAQIYSKGFKITQEEKESLTTVLDYDLTKGDKKTIRSLI